MKRKQCSSMDNPSDNSFQKKAKHETAYSFLTLSAEDQLDFCRKKGRQMQSFWNDYERAKDNGSYVIAALCLAQAIRSGYTRAINLILSDTSLAISSEELLCLPQNAEEHFQAGLRYKLGLGLQQSNEKAFASFSAAGELGHADAQFILGALYQKDNDLDKGLDWLKKASEQKNAPAQHYLAVIYRDGVGVSQDVTESDLYQNLAAHQGYSSTLCVLGRSFGNDKQWNSSFLFMQCAAEQDDREAQAFLGKYYVKGLGVEKNVEEGLLWYKKAVEQNHADAQYELGCIYYDGDDIEEDIEEGLLLLKKAAEQNQVDAQFELGNIYSYNDDIEEDINAAIAWYIKAAEQNHVVAQYELGVIFSEGNSFFDPDTDEAIFWLKQAAEQNHVDAQYQLGCIYNLDSDDRNLEEAIKWLKKAAEQNHVDAQYELGMLYMYTEDIVDFKKGIKWLKKAAEQNKVYAQYNLGVNYSVGFGVEQDIAEGVRWFRKAAIQNDLESLGKLKTMTSPLAVYAVAWIENNEQALIQAIATDKEVQQEFIEYDLLKITSVYTDEQMLADFISELVNQYRLANANDSSFFTSCLLKLDAHVRASQVERNERDAQLQTSLLAAIEWSEVSFEHINPLMAFLCDSYYESCHSREECLSLVQAQTLLWYRAQSFGMGVEEQTSCKVFLSVLINYCYRGQYQLSMNSKITQEDMALLVTLCARNPAPSIEKVKELLIHDFIEESTADFEATLSKLKTCLESAPGIFYSSLNKILSTPLLMRPNHWHNVLTDLQVQADMALNTNKSFFFSAPLNDGEKALALALNQNATQPLLQWIKNYGACVQSQDKESFTPRFQL